MKQNLDFKELLFMIAILFAINVNAQDLKIKVDEKGRVGFADHQGNEVINCQYESAQPFKNGVAIVMKSGKYGLIDATGNVILPLKYTQIQTWSDVLFLIKEGKKMGLANHQGNVVLPVNYSHISKPNCYGKALIALGGKATKNDKNTYMANAKYGIIDDKGNILINPQYKGLYEFSYDGTNKYPYFEGKRLEYSYHNTVDTLITDCSYIGFCKNGYSIYKSGIMDGNGKELLPLGLYDFVMQPKSNMVRYYITNKKETLCGYHNIETNSGFQATAFNYNIDNIEFWSHGDFIGDIAPVNGTSWSFIDKKGNTIRSGYSSLIHNQPTGLWAAKNSSGKWDVFDDSNSDISTLSGFDAILFPANNGDTEIFSVMKNNKYGCITRMGETKIPFNYDQALGNTFDMVAVKQNGKWGMLSPENSNIIPIEYANIFLPSERDMKHMWVMKSDSLYYHFNTLTKKVSGVGYKNVSNFSNGVAHVAPVGMQIDDTPLNRAQVFEPNTPKTTIYAWDMSNSVNAFGYIINTDDVILMDLPVSTLYMDAVVKEIEKRGVRTLSSAEKKNILLDVTRENRSYDLNSILNEDEWNY